MPSSKKAVLLPPGHCLIPFALANFINYASEKENLEIRKKKPWCLSLIEFYKASEIQCYKNINITMFLLLTNKFKLDLIFMPKNKK